MTWRVSVQDAATPVLNNIKQSLEWVSKSVQTNSEKIQQRSKNNREGLTAMGVAAWAAFYGIVSLVKWSVTAAEEYQRSLAQMNAVLKSTGDASGMTAEWLKKLALQLSEEAWVQDEVIMSAENMMLTFTQVGKQAFPEATKAAIDMATAMNGGIVPSVEQARDSALRLGIALNDPEKWFTRLHRVWVEFSADQEKQIKASQKAWDMYKAQKIILDELAKEFGGSAAANAATFEGEMNKLNVQFDEANRTLGESLQPTLAWIISQIQPLVKEITTRTEWHKELTKNLILWAAAITWTIALLAGLGLAIGPIIAGFWVLFSPVTAVIIALGALVYVGYNVIKSYNEMRDAMSLYNQWMIDAGWNLTDFWKKMAAIDEATKKEKEAMDANNASFKTLQEMYLDGSATRAEFLANAKAAEKGMQANIWYAQSFIELAKVSQATIGAIWAIKGVWLSNIVWGVAGANLTPAVNKANDLVAQFTGNIKKIQSEMKTYTQDFTKNTGAVADSSWSAAKKIEGFTKDMQKNFKDFSQKSSDYLWTLKDNFDKDMADLSKKAWDVNKQLTDLNKQYATDTGDTNKSMAEEIIAQQTKIADIKKQIADQMASNTKDGVANETDATLIELNKQLAAEQKWYEATAQVRIDLANEITEAQRRSWLTEIQRQLEDYQSQKLLAQQQYSEKYSQLQLELSDIKTQQKSIQDTYNTTYKYINDQIKTATDQYATTMAQQAKLTQDKVDIMKTAYDDLTRSIQKAVDAQSKLSSTWISAIGTKKYADWGVISGGIKAFASGGVVNSPTLGLIWEGMYNEAVVPLPNGQSIPVEMRGGGNGWINITIWNLFGTDKSTAIAFANEIIAQFKGQSLFPSF